MKKTIFGSAMMLGGIVSTALLMAGSMSLNFSSDGNYSFIRNLVEYDLIIPLFIFIVIAVIGVIIVFREI